MKRLGVEFDEVSLDLKALLEEHFPGVELVDCAASAMALRTIKSAEEHVLIRGRRHVRRWRAGADGGGQGRRAGT